jgi:hypothetical protein
MGLEACKNSFHATADREFLMDGSIPTKVPNATEEYATRVLVLESYTARLLNPGPSPHPSLLACLQDHRPDC